MIESGKWAHVPGTRDVQMYPLIRRPSIICSNSFVLATPSQIIVIDPGADSLQIAEIGSVVNSLLAEAPRPVFVYLSHCHIDHFFAMPSLLEASPGARLICHAEGTRALSSRDVAVTVSDLHALDVPACSVWASIFGPEEQVDEEMFMPAVERLIDDFHYFVDGFKGKELKNVILVRALHFMARFDKTFSPESVSYLLNPLILRRIRILFAEFYHTVYGFRFVLPEDGFDLPEAVKEAVSKAREPLFSDQAVLDATGADETFLKALTSRIAEHPLFEGIRFVLDSTCRAPAPVRMDRAVFQDLLMILLERLAARGFERIELVPEGAREKPSLFVSAAASSETSRLEGRQLRIIQRTMQNHGGDFRELQGGSFSRFVFEFPV